MATTIHIGTYAESGGQGLVPLLLEPGGALKAGEPYPQVSNASFAVTDGETVYATDEQDEGALTIVRREGEGWRHIARLATEGAAPCFVETDGRRLAVANYQSGTVTLWALGDDGLPQGSPTQFQSRGQGPNKERQEGPHAHCVRFAPGSKALYVVDLGADTIWHLELAEEGGLGEARPAWCAPPGTGPRQLLFHPTQPLALLLSELASTLTLLEVRPDGDLDELHTLSTLPEGFASESLGGHLDVIDGRVIVSNRGHNSLAVFTLAEEALTLLGHVASGGNHPRHFAQVGAQLVVAHEKDGQVATFSLTRGALPVASGYSVQVPGACFVLA